MRGVAFALAGRDHTVLFFALLAVVIWQLWQGFFSIQGGGASTRVDASRDPGWYWLMIVLELVMLVVLAVHG